MHTCNLGQYSDKMLMMTPYPCSNSDEVSCPVHTAFSPLSQAVSSFTIFLSFPYAI